MTGIFHVQQYFNNARVLNISNLTQLEQDQLPNSWVDILNQTNMENRILKTLEYWKNFEVELEQVFKYLKTNLVSLNLFFNGHEYCLLYGVQAKEVNEVFYYLAKNPLQKKNTKKY